MAGPPPGTVQEVRDLACLRRTNCLPKPCSQPSRTTLNQAPGTHNGKRTVCQRVAFAKACTEPGPCAWPDTFVNCLCEAPNGPDVARQCRQGRAHGTITESPPSGHSSVPLDMPASGRTTWSQTHRTAGSPHQNRRKLPCRSKHQRPTTKTTARQPTAGSPDPARSLRGADRPHLPQSVANAFGTIAHHAVRQRHEGSPTTPAQPAVRMAESPTSLLGTRTTRMDIRILRMRHSPRIPTSTMAFAITLHCTLTRSPDSHHVHRHHASDGHPKRNIITVAARFSAGSAIKTAHRKKAFPGYSGPSNGFDCPWQRHPPALHTGAGNTKHRTTTRIQCAPSHPTCNSHFRACKLQMPPFLSHH